MLSTVIDYASSTLVLCAVSFVAGGILWPKVKGFVLQEPAALRPTLSALEGKIKNDLRTASADVISRYVPAATKAPVPPAAPAAEPPKA